LRAPRFFMKTACVLHADDDAQFRELLRDTVAADVLEWVEADSGAKAWDIFRRRGESISLIVTDGHMANGDGLWLLSQIQASPFERPVLFLSSDMDLVGKSWLAGAALGMNKTTPILELRDVILSLLDE